MTTTERTYSDRRILIETKAAYAGPFCPGFVKQDPWPTYVWIWIAEETAIMWSSRPEK